MLIKVGENDRRTRGHVNGLMVISLPFFSETTTCYVLVALISTMIICLSLKRRFILKGDDDVWHET